MSVLNVGDWFAYQRTVAISGHPQGDVQIERYVIKEINGTKVKLARDINNGAPTPVDGDISYGSYFLDYSDFEKRGSENMKTEFGSMYVSIYEKEDGDEGARTFIGKDNIAFRIIRTKNTDRGLYTESLELCWSNVKL